MGSIARLGGINYIGMRRRDYSRESQQAVRKAYRTLFFSEGQFAARVDAVDREFGSDPAVAEIIKFVRADAARALLQPGEHRQE
jgi:UDP-N-acetylglucosamine acyltransferase